jgi:vacuolar-type H+-ATPase subunit E/Vma4
MKFMSGNSSGSSKSNELEAIKVQILMELEEEARKISEELKVEIQGLKEKTLKALTKVG